MKFLGNLTEDQIIDFKFSTHTATGTPITLAGTPVVKVYKANATDSEVSTGVTLSVDFDGVTGLHNVRIDTSAAAFYAVANDYSVVITTGTVDGVSVVGTVLATFSIENRFKGDTSGTTELLTRVVNTKIASTTGNWATAGTWADAAVPSAGDNIIIRTGVTVTVAAELDLGTFGTLELQGTAALNIAEGQTVAVVPVGWTVEDNAGTVTTNNGTVTSNQGAVMTNAGTVKTNIGLGFIATNASGGTVTTNEGEVTTNVGVVTTNAGVVTTNAGTVTTNASGGTVTTNEGEVTTNAGTVTTNSSGGKVFNNFGTVTTNNGTKYDGNTGDAYAGTTELLLRVPDGVLAKLDSIVEVVP